MAVTNVESRSVILVVEDEESYQDALNIGLTVEGFVVVGATNIAQARQLMVSAKPDLVLLDIMLPDGSGIDYCRELYDSTRTPVIDARRARESETAWDASRLTSRLTTLATIYSGRPLASS